MRWIGVLAGLCALLFSTEVMAYDQMHIALIKRINPTSDLALLAREQDRAQERAEDMELFLRKMSHYRWGEIKVKGFVLASDCDYNNPYYCEDDIQTMLPAIESEDFKPEWFNVWVSWVRPSICGMAPLGGKYSITYGGCTAATNIHEHFHNLGIHHAMKNGSEYGDTMSILGKSNRMNGLNTVNLLDLDLQWTEPSLLFFSTEILLTPVEIFPESLHISELQHVIIDPEGRTPVYLSMRKSKGFPYTSVGHNPSMVYVHIRGLEDHDEDNYDLRKSNWIDTLYVGDSRQITETVRVDYLEYDNETARLAVIVNGEELKTEPLVINTELPEIVPTLDQLHSGLWYNPDFPGQGFDIQVKGERAVLTWYTFNGTVNNATRWYIASGRIHDTTFDLHTVYKGELRAAGTVQMHFYDGVTGVINYNTTDHGRGSIPINQLMQSHSSALWYQPSVDLKGFSGHFYDDKLIMYWFTDGFRPHNIVTTMANSWQRWFMFMGVKDGDQYNLDIYEVTGGNFLMFDSVDIIRVGEAILHPDMQLEIVRMSADSFSEPGDWIPLTILF